MLHKLVKFDQQINQSLLSKLFSKMYFVFDA